MGLEGYIIGGPIKMVEFKGLLTNFHVIMDHFHIIIKSRNSNWVFSSVCESSQSKVN